MCVYLISFDSLLLKNSLVIGGIFFCSNIPIYNAEFSEKLIV
jgi:hypothetical protein